MLVNLLLVRRLRSLGIKMPIRMVLAARAAKCPLPAACAMLMMETGGGRNVFGHDPTSSIPESWKGGEVTEERYRAYRKRRGPTGRGGMQGVGPTQLTWYSFQDTADEQGGCWKPLVNMRVGFTILAWNIRRYGLRTGFRAYNGSGEAAERYAARAMTLHTQFAAALKVKPPAPKKRTIVPGTWWKKWVYGDTDVERDLLVRLANVAKARGAGVRIYIRSGKRSRAEQQVLYAKYLREGWPLAAKPGTSRHETGRAADCQIDIPGRGQVNIGDDGQTRALLPSRGLCLPVKGESWHVEVC